MGTPLTKLSTSDLVPTFNGIDWTLFPSVPRAVRFLQRQRPEFVVLLWWTASSLPAYLVLLRTARRRGARVILELHEDLDTAEAQIPLVGVLAKRGIRLLLRRADAYVVHSEWDRERFHELYGLEKWRIHVIPHGPFELASSTDRSEGARGPDGVLRILFFGTIRPYKGLEDLVDAFDRLPRQDGTAWRLLVVGETWQGWTLPLEKISASRHRDDIQVVNRYVTDEEVRGFFVSADLVALPYLRSSASGPLHLTMSAGLPVVAHSSRWPRVGCREVLGRGICEPGGPGRSQAGDPGSDRADRPPTRGPSLVVNR